MTETVPERIRVVVTEAEVIGPFPPDDDRATDYVPVTALEAAQARIQELEDRWVSDTGKLAVRGEYLEDALATARREALEEAHRAVNAMLVRNPRHDEARLHAKAAIRAIMEEDNANG